MILASFVKKTKTCVELYSDWDWCLLSLVWQSFGLNAMKMKLKLHYINPKGKFILSPPGQRKGTSV